MQEDRNFEMAEQSYEKVSMHFRSKMLGSDEQPNSRDNPLFNKITHSQFPFSEQNSSKAFVRLIESSQVEKGLESE